jgi:hypothetical protein
MIVLARCLELLLQAAVIFALLAFAMAITGVFEGGSDVPPS